jgi:hypothetical protein
MNPSHLIACMMVATLLPKGTHAAPTVERWASRYNGPGNRDDRAAAVAVDGAGNVIIAGASCGKESTADVHTAKYRASDGALLWERRYSGAPYLGRHAAEGATGVAVDHAGNVLVTGFASSSNDSRDYYTAKYAAADGALRWEKQYGSAFRGSTEVATDIAVDSAGNAIVTGYSVQNNVREDRTVKYSWKDGALLWEIRTVGTAGVSNAGLALVLDGADNLIVSGQTALSRAPFGFYVAKYSPGGTPLWEQSNNGTQADNHFTNAVVVDAAGNVIVAGYSVSATGNSDYYTAKYAAADGALLWEKRYNGLFNGNDTASALAVDSEGNVIVTGASIGGLCRKDRYTAKYAAADGAVIWERRATGSIGEAYGSAVVVDEANDVIVAGSLDDVFHTAKYAGATGAPLWQKYYNGQSTGADIINGRKQLALTPGGGVVVTGYSWNGKDNDYATVKYGPDNDVDRDGLLDDWERAHFGTLVGHSALDDADGDGLTELLELAFNRDPLRPDAAGAPAVVNEGGFLTTTITKRAGVSYTVESAATPDAPAFSAATTTVLLENATTLKVRDNFPIGSATSRLMRVKVTSAP